MNDNTKKSFRDELVAQEKNKTIPQTFQEEVKMMTQTENKQFHLMKASNLPVIFLMVLLIIVFVFSHGLHSWGIAPVLMLAVGLIFLLGVGILLGISILQIRVELLKEIKSLRLELYELGQKFGERR